MENLVVAIEAVIPMFCLMFIGVLVHSIGCSAMWNWFI